MTDRRSNLEYFQIIHELIENMLIHDFYEINFE